MRAEQIAEQAASIGLDADVLAAARAVTRGEPAGVVVADPVGRPCGLLPVCEVVAATVPGFVRQSPRLANVYDEELADRTLRMMLGRPVREVLADSRFPVTDGDATAVELATVMAATRSPLVVVRLAHGGWGVVTGTRLLACLLPG